MVTNSIVREGRFEKKQYVEPSPFLAASSGVFQNLGFVFSRSQSMRAIHIMICG
jgi:hypothetical protein